MTSTKKSDHYFFSILALYYLVTAFLGFGYSSAQRLSEDGELPLRAIIHGAAGGIWYTLFFLQVFLIVLKKRKTHQLIGKISVPVILMVFATGIYVVLLRGPIPFEEVPFAVQGFEIGLFFIGMIYVILGYINRYVAHDHKRYYLLSIVVLSGAGIQRFFSFIQVEMFNGFVITFLIPFILLIAYDFIAYRKLFKATWIGILIFLLNMFVLSRVFKSFADYARPLLE